MRDNDFRILKWPLLCLGIWSALVLAYALIVPAGYEGPGLCMFRNVTGVPCPTCGGTRAVMALGRGDIAQAAALNPLVIVAIGAALVWAFLRPLIARFRISGALTLVAVVGLLVLNWVYLIARGV